MNNQKPLWYYSRLGMVFVSSGVFFLVSVYAKTWTEHNIFPILFPAVVLSAWIGGKTGGLISTLVLSVSTAYFHLPPEGFAVSDPDDLVRLGTFTLTGAFVAWLSGALKESQVMMISTLKSIGDAVIATDRRGSIRFMNPAAEVLTGWSSREATGRLIAEVFQVVDAETELRVSLPLPAALQSVFALPENTYLISKSRDRVYIDDSLAPVHADSGKVLGAILVFRDATRRRQSEAAVLEFERHRLRTQRMEAIGRLAGGVAHDFNNLLTVINGYADLVLKQIVVGDPLRVGVEQIRQAGDKAAALTRQLLVFGRGQPVKLEITDLNHIVANFVTLLRRLIGEDIDLHTRLAPCPLYVRVDIGQVEQVIMNLAVNARDAMPNGGRLTIETELEQPGQEAGLQSQVVTASVFAVLKVTDTGVGIDSKTKAHLFEPFFTTKEAGHGSGLGLSVVFGIVNAHNGRVTVESQPGRGSVFGVYIPSIDLLDNGPEQDVPVEAVLRSGSATILVVEDDPEVRRLLTQALESLGYTVLAVEGPAAAMAITERHPGPIDLVVTDIVMPALSGLDLAKHLKSIYPEIRVLYVTGYTDRALIANALGSAETAYLGKPFGLEELARKVEEVLRLE